MQRRSPGDNGGRSDRAQPWYAMDHAPNFLSFRALAMNSGMRLKAESLPRPPYRQADSENLSASSLRHHSEESTTGTGWRPWHFKVAGVEWSPVIAKRYLRGRPTVGEWGANSLRGRWPG